MNKGFTLIEIMVTLGIMVSLLVISLAYSRNSTQQIALLKDRAQVLQEVVRARSLTAALFKEDGDKICGYGIHFPSGANPDTGKLDRMILFKDLPVDGENCPKEGEQEYSGPSEIVTETLLDPTVKFCSTPPDILFFPPKPDLYFGGEIAGPTNEDVDIEVCLVSDISQTATINVNLIGQVSTE